MYHVTYYYHYNRGPRHSVSVSYNHAEDAMGLVEALVANRHRHVRLERTSENETETLLEIGPASPSAQDLMDELLYSHADFRTKEGDA